MQPPEPPHLSGFATQELSCCGERSNNTPVLSAMWLSKTAVAAKAQQLPHPPCCFTAVTTLGRCWRQSMLLGCTLLARSIGRFGDTAGLPPALAPAMALLYPKRAAISPSVAAVSSLTPAVHKRFAPALCAAITESLCSYKALRSAISDAAYLRPNLVMKASKLRVSAGRGNAASVCPMRAKNSKTANPVIATLAVVGGQGRRACSLSKMA
mmetsp:Transcript_15003/g.35150  ORF Transcript_15003/g.35150 Transcript_15003/m.35150 type:complete len:211 (-) Transcript_15003:7-639(-)